MTESVFYHSLLRILAKWGDCKGCMKFIEENGCDEIKAKQFYLALSKFYVIEQQNNSEISNDDVFKKYRQTLQKGKIPTLEDIKK